MKRVGDVWYPVGDGVCAVYRYAVGDRWQYKAHCAEHGWIATGVPVYFDQQSAESQALAHMCREHGWQ